MAHHQELEREARKSYVSGRKAEAALLFRRAASAALDIGDKVSWFENLVWAANSASLAGDEITSLGLLLEARQAEPDGAAEFTRWLARKQLLVINRASCPELARLRKLLDELREFASQIRASAGDMLVLQGYIEEDRGHFAEALVFYEAAWREHNGKGFIKPGIAFDAALCCLRLGQCLAARDWIGALSSAEEQWRDLSRVWAKNLSVRLALAQEAPRQEMLTGIRSFIELSLPLQGAEERDDLRELVVRVQLVASIQDDPGACHHPARTELRRRRARKYDVGCRYLGRLLFLDYRLACLRYTAGVPPVDDFYYTKSQASFAAVQPHDAADFNLCRHKARVAANWAMIYARYLDGLLECDWRQREVQSRMDRIEQIVGRLK